MNETELVVRPVNLCNVPTETDQSRLKAPREPRSRKFNVLLLILIPGLNHL